MIVSNRREVTFREAGRTLVLSRRGAHHELTIGGIPILTSALLGTERAFGRLVARLREREGARVLIGGLGFGATLAGVLETVGPRAKVAVVERLSTVIRLARDHPQLSSIARPALEDPRVTLLRADVRQVIARERDLDAILLDVDNGPEWASFRSNARLYDERGLRESRRALRPGGIWAVWSGYPRGEFPRRLRAAGFSSTVVELRERGRVQARAYVGQRDVPAGVEKFAPARRRDWAADPE